MMRTPAWALTWSILRVVAAAGVVAAVVAQLIRTVGIALESTTPYGSDVPTVFANFLSFFTIQSNILAAVTLVIGAVWCWTKGRDAAVEPNWYATLLACATTYMVITGVVYNTLLRGIPLPQGATVPWSNEVLHLWVPLFLILDLLLAPKRRALPWRTVWIIVIYPIVWVVYTMVRGPLITAPSDGAPYWYPYPFLNPNNPALFPTPGYGGVAFWIAVISAAFVAVGFLVVWIGRRRGVAPAAS